ncbi:MAG TPA: RNA polymerase sigma-54 factor, partial [Pelovirga sp.]|nr:RNA polymerase sigma-54 factor [Pelovirga sp.]
MALDLRLQVKLSQQLVMTPQLQQAIKLLQLSRLELVEAISEELAENPVLEEGMDHQEQKEEDLRAGVEDDATPAQESSPEQELSGEMDGVADIDWQTYLEGYSLNSSSNDARDNYEEQEDRPSFESLMTQPRRLSDHLLWQLGLSTVPAGEHQAAVDIIGNLDDAGYL